MNEVSIIVPFCGEASVRPHCLERLQRIGEQLAAPRELLQNPPELMPRVVSARGARAPTWS